MLDSTATLKITSVLGLRTKQMSLTGLGHQVQHLHPQLDPLWTTQQALVSNSFECIYLIHGGKWFNRQVNRISTQKKLVLDALFK